MSYAVPAVPGAPKRRPPVVSLAGYLLYLVAALLIILAVLPLPSLSKVVDATREAWQGSTNPTPDTAANLTQIQAIVQSVLFILVAVVFAVSASLVLRGRQVGRILSFVFGGIGVLCSLCGVVLSGLSGQITTSTKTSNGLDINKINDHINAARPGYLTPTAVTLDVVNLLALIAIVILLAMPAASAFFRKEPEIMVVNDPAFPTTPYPAPQTPPPATPPSDTPPPAGPTSDGPPPSNPPSA